MFWRGGALRNTAHARGVTRRSTTPTLSRSQLNMECPVCLETKSGREVKTLSCTHQVCVDCWVRWTQVHTRVCPLCRAVHREKRKRDTSREREVCADLEREMVAARRDAAARRLQSLIFKDDLLVDALNSGNLYTLSGLQIHMSDMFVPLAPIEPVEPPLFLLNPNQ